MKSALKITAVLTLLAFTSTSLGWAQPVQNQAPKPFVFKLPASVEIPKAYGFLQASSVPKSSDKPLILYIQDAHAVTDAQESIQKLIAHFQSVYPVNRVLLEGLSGTIDPLLLRSFPGTFAREKIMRGYFLKGELTGPEMAAVLNPESAVYEGLEDKTLYEENTRVYLTAVSRKPAFEAEIQSREKRLQAERDASYSPQAKELHEIIEKFNSDLSRFTELLQYLGRFKKEGEKYPHLKTLLETGEENSGTEKKAELQLGKMAEAFRVQQSGRLNAEDQRFFQEKFQAFRTHALDAGSFLQILIDLGSPLGMKPRLTPELETVLSRHQKLSALQGGQVFEELEAFLGMLEDQAANTPEAKQTLDKTRTLRLLKKLASLELTRKQWEALSRKQAALLAQGLWKPAADFYALALKRDQVFHEKLQHAVSKDHGAVIVVAGGFHAQGFESFLKENHYPYVSVLPAMHSLSGHEKYASLMQGNVSWAKEIRTSLYDGFMRHASKQFTEALNPLEGPSQLKLWRDEILRALAKEGRIEKAGNYTKYLVREQSPSSGTGSKIHEVIQSYKKRTMDSVWKNFEFQFAEFSAGFQKLADSNQLSRESISALLQAKPSMLALSLAKMDPSSKSRFIQTPRIPLEEKPSAPRKSPETVSGNRAEARPSSRDEDTALLSAGRTEARPLSHDKATALLSAGRTEARLINPEILRPLEGEQLRELSELIQTKTDEQRNLVNQIETRYQLSRLKLSLGLHFSPILIGALFLAVGGVNWPPFWQNVFLLAALAVWSGGLLFSHFQQFSGDLKIKMELMDLEISRQLIEKEIQSRNLPQTPSEESDPTSKRPENRHEDDTIGREEFLEFLEGRKEGDLPTGDITQLGSVGQRLYRSLRYLTDHFGHYGYRTESEMWGDLIDMLWEKREKFHANLEQDRPSNHYVETAAKHALIDRYRKMRTQEKAAMRAAGADAENVLEDLLTDSRELRPDESAIATESGIHLAKALAHLTPEAAQLIRLHFWDQLSYAEIAEVLHREPGKVRYQILKAMEDLKPWLPHSEWTHEDEDSGQTSRILPADAQALNNAILHLKETKDRKKHPEKTERSQRIIFFYRDGLAMQRIAEIMGIELFTVGNTINRAKKAFNAVNPHLWETLLAIRAENGGQVQHREKAADQNGNKILNNETVSDDDRSEMRHVELRNGQLLRLGNLDHMKDLLTVLQREWAAYFYDSFRLTPATRYVPGVDKDGHEVLTPRTETLKKVPDRIFVYDPVGALLEKRPLDSVFREPERYKDLLAKSPEDLKSPFEKNTENFQLLLQGLIKPFLEELGLSDRLDDVHMSFEKEMDAEGYPLFHFHFKLLGLGPQLTHEDFLRAGEEDYETFKQALEFWYPYLFVRTDINLMELDAKAVANENLGRKYPVQRRPSLYAGALDRIGEASHVIFRQQSIRHIDVIASEVSKLLELAAQDLKDAFPEHSPAYEPIERHLQELELLRKYANLVVKILISKYRIRRESRPEARALSAERPKVTVYGGGDDEGPGSSAFLLEIGKTKVLLDGGSGSWKRFEKNPPQALDAIVLSHAHNDHSGDLPWISARFPEAPVYSSAETAETALLMMEDAASFQPNHHQRSYKNNTRELKKRFLFLDPKVWVQITPEMKIRFQPASHIAGANLVYIATPYRNYIYTGDFSGDAIRGAETLEILDDFPVDELWEESTYGATVNSKNREEREGDFSRDLNRILTSRGRVLIPTFAIGRTADVAITIRSLQQRKLVPEAPIYVDGLAAFNLESYMRHLSDSNERKDTELYRLLEEGIVFVNASLRENLKTGRIEGPFMILGGSGSLAGGRALQYFPVIARDPKNAVILVGHQFPGTVGRELKEGKRNFFVEGEAVMVSAEVMIHDFGAHARQDSLIHMAVKTKPRFTFLIHGELAAKKSLKALLETRGFSAVIPKTGEIVTPDADDTSLLGERQNYFDQLSAVLAPDLGKETKTTPVIYDLLPEQEQEDLIGALLVALDRKRFDKDGDGHKMIRQLVESKRTAGEIYPLTAVIQETRARLKAGLDAATAKEKPVVRNRVWRELQRQAGRTVLTPVRLPSLPRVRTDGRTPEMVIADRRQRTLDEFSKNIADAFIGENGSTPSNERIREVVAFFLDQTQVTVNGHTYVIRKEDGGLHSGNVAWAIQEYLGNSKAKREERWRNAWAGLLRDFGNRAESRLWGDEEPPFPINEDTSPRLSADLLRQKGIHPEEFTVLMYPAAGNYDADLLSIFKRKNFPNLREFHLNSRSYDARIGGAQAGRMVKKALLNYLENPGDVEVFLDDRNYFSEEMSFSVRSAGKRIWLHKWMGDNDKNGLRSELYTDTLLKGFVRPGDLIFVVTRGQSRHNPFKWSRPILDEPVKLQGMKGFRDKDELWRIYEVTEKDVENAREMAQERAEFRGNVLPLLLPSTEEILQVKNLDALEQNARRRLENLGARFDRFETEAGNLTDPEETALEVIRIFGEWAPSINKEAFAGDLARAANGEITAEDDRTLAVLKTALLRPEILAEHFPAAFSPFEGAALESQLLFALAEKPEEISAALKEMFQWTGLLYLKKSSVENAVLQIVKTDGEHFSAVPYEGEKSVRSRKLGRGANAPAVWSSENLLNFAGDQAREAQFKERGFQISAETLSLLTAQKLSLKETLLLLKLFSVPGPLRDGLPLSEDGFRILTGQGLQAGAEYLSGLLAAEAESARRLASAA